MALVHNLCYIVHLSDINLVIVVDYKLHYVVFIIGHSSHSVCS